MDEKGKRRTEEKTDDDFEREEESLSSPSGASSVTSSCSISDEEEFEFGEDQSVRDEEQTEKAEDEMPKKVTIYKISNKFLPKDAKDDTSLRSCLLEKFKNEKALTLKEKDNEQYCLEPYRCIWFTYKFDENVNRMSKFIDQKLTGEETSIPRGNRRTSNLMILYRVTSDNTPEAFGVCESYPPQKILFDMSDSKFRNDVANALMDGKRIVELETMNIVGPEIRTKKFFATQSHENCPRLNEVVTSATSFMRTDSSVFAVLGGKKENPPIMTIKLNCFRFELKMSLEKCAEVLKSLQKEVTKDDGVTFYNVDNVYRDFDETRIEKYEKELKSAFINYICDGEETPHSDYSLSHRYFEDEEWSESLSVQLFRQIPLKGKQKEYKEVCSWRYPPSVGELKSRLQTFYEVVVQLEQADTNSWRSRMLEDLNKDLIFLSFGGNDNYQKLLTYVHGSVYSRELFCKVYKSAQEWYVLTPAFSKLVDRDFVEFAKGALLSKEEGKLPLPWNRSTLSEGQYNEKYLDYQANGDKIFIPGDRVCFNNIELFDILMHDSRNKVTYLYHVKEGLGQTTRDACSQIRVSAQLFWMDRLQGKQTNALGFYKNATTSRTAETEYREKLRRRMLQIGKETFINMLQQKLIFVYAFLSKTVKVKLHPADLSDFKPITPSDFDKNGEDIVGSLKELNILTDLGYLDDTFLDITKDGFPTSARKNAYLNTLYDTTLEDIYDTLVKHGRCKVSTIAKMELLELNRQFTEYQIAGEKVFELKVFRFEKHA